MKNFKRKIFEIIEDDISDCLLHRIFEAFIIGLIILNVFLIIIESCIHITNSYLRGFEIFSVVVFTLEYILRVWTADLKFEGYSKVKSRVRFIFSLMGIIDILSILPFYITLFLPITFDGRILRIFRLLRLLRILKLSRFLDSFGMIKKVIKERKNELLITAFIAFILIVIASTLMFEIEHEAQPDKFPDIISTFWWAIATLTTIGYGDVFPITAAGKFISALVSLIGIGFIALPTGILCTSFIEEFRNKNKVDEKEERYCFCPHCGKKLEGDKN